MLVGARVFIVVRYSSSECDTAGAFAKGWGAAGSKERTNIHDC
jgi:hypothetical protein